MRRALERSAERPTGSEARAFAVVGMDSDSSHVSALRLSLSLGNEGRSELIHFVEQSGSE